MNYKHLKSSDPEIYKLVRAETRRQASELTLIASENYAWPAVLEALASPLTNKYAEGYVGKRYYSGNKIIDKVETLAIERAKALFCAEHANVQALSGTPANLAIYSALCNYGDTILGLSLSHGGHLSHGHSVSASGKLYKFINYEVDQTSEQINFEKLRQLALENQPKIIVAGFSAYPRNIDWQKFRNICDEVGAYLLIDLSHTAGMVAAGVLPNPTNLADVVMMTTHKTLRGPRAAIVLCKLALAEKIDKAIFPGTQGGPHENTIAAVAVCLAEAQRPEFKTYAEQILANAKVMADELKNLSYHLVADGTDTHLLILDLSHKNINGREAENLLAIAGINTSRSTIPFDPLPPTKASGLRLGTAAITARGMKETEVKILVKMIDEILKANDKKLAKQKKAEIKELCKKFPVQ